jgi:hypothetical protein
MAHMRRLILAALFLAGSSALAIAGEIPIDHQTYPLPQDRQVQMEFPVGDLRVETTSGDKIEFDLRAKCRGWNCEDRASRIYIDAYEKGGELTLHVKGYPHTSSGGLSLIGVLRVPKDHALHIEMGVGDLDIDGIAGDIEVSLGVGDATIHTDERTVGSVSCQAGVGDADVRTRAGRVRRHGFIGSTANWDGSGRSSVDVRVGVGDANVRVD